MATHLLHTRLVLPLAAAALFGLAGCGADNSSVASPAGSQAAGDLKAADSSLGRIVVDAKGMTAYYFTKDRPNSGTSACTGPCLQAWPPITSTASSPAAAGITGKVGTITLANGSKQLTVNGRPVYLFAKDAEPGDVSGQGVGSVWYVLRPDGTMVTDQPSSGSGGY